MPSRSAHKPKRSKAKRPDFHPAAEAKHRAGISLNSKMRGSIEDRATRLLLLLGLLLLFLHRHDGHPLMRVDLTVKSGASLRELGSFRLASLTVINNGTSRMDTQHKNGKNAYISVA